MFCHALQNTLYGTSRVFNARPTSAFSPILVERTLVSGSPATTVVRHLFLGISGKAWVLKISRPTWVTGRDVTRVRSLRVTVVAVITELILRLTSIDLNACNIDSLEELFTFG